VKTDDRLEADVRILLQLVTYCDFLIDNGGVITRESWNKQFEREERRALQRLVDTVGL
jgi:hypothetical protein